MTSASDITMMLTSDGREWGKYISDKLKGFPQITSNSLVLDDLEYENAPEVTLACRQSAVVLLLATPQLLDHMRERAGWFSKSLQEVPSTSSVVVILLLDNEDMEDVTKDHYVTSEWTYLDAGYGTKDDQQMIARVQLIVDNCQLAKEKAERAEKERASGAQSRPPPPPTKPKPPNVLVQLFPSTVYESGLRVAMVFKEEVKGDVTLKVEQTDLQLTTKRENATVFTFSAPRLAPGKYTLLVFEDNKRLCCRPKLTFHGVEMSAFTSPHYLMQALELRDLSELDLRLKDAFNDSLPGDRGLDNVFQKLPPPDLAERQKNFDTQYPTILHYAAAHGLSEFCAALLEFPVSSRAFRIRNSDGLDPAELAAERGFGELENYIIDFMDMKKANEICDEHITVNLLPKDKGKGKELAHARSERPGSPASVLQTVPESHPTCCILPAGSGLDAEALMGASDNETEQACAMSERYGSSASVLQTVPESNPLSRTPPAGSGLDAKAFMGIGASDNAIKRPLPRGALGCRSLNELIEVQEMVKTGEINLNEAQMLYNAWMHRHGRNNAASFRERKKKLSEIKKVKEKQSKQSVPPKSFLHRLGIGGRQTKHTIKLNISSHPGRSTVVHSESASTSQLPLETTERDGIASTATPPVAGKPVPAGEGGGGRGQFEASSPTSSPTNLGTPPLPSCKSTGTGRL